MAQTAEAIEIGHPVSGSPQDLIARMQPAAKASQARTGVYIEVKSNSSASVDLYIQALDMVGRLFAARLEKVADDSIQKIVEVFVPDKPVTSSKLKQALMIAKAKTAVLNSGDWITANDIAGLARFSTANPSSQPSKWKREKRIFAVRHEGIDYFPIYGLDETSSYRPLPALKQVINVLEAMKDGWAMAYWFMSANGWLGGKRPQDLLVSAPDRVIAAAREEVAGITHG
ncbi:hypothetical protein [Pseudomonas putida]